jgi:hypothetical protein
MIMHTAVTRVVGHLANLEAVRAALGDVEAAGLRRVLDHHRTHNTMIS